MVVQPVEYATVDDDCWVIRDARAGPVIHGLVRPRASTARTRNRLVPVGFTRTVAAGLARVFETFVQAPPLMLFPIS